MSEDYEAKSAGCVSSNNDKRGKASFMCDLKESEQLKHKWSISPEVSVSAFSLCHFVGWFTLGSTAWKTS